MCPATLYLPYLPEFMFGLHSNSKCENAKHPQVYDCQLCFLAVLYWIIQDRTQD